MGGAGRVVGEDGLKMSLISIPDITAISEATCHLMCSNALLAGGM